MWQPVATEETCLLENRGDFVLDFEQDGTPRCAVKDVEDSDMPERGSLGRAQSCCEAGPPGAACKERAAGPAGPPGLKPLLKRSSDGTGKRTKKRVRWADLERQKESSLRCFDDTLRPCTLSTGVMTAILTLFLIALMGSWSSKVSRDTTVLLRLGEAHTPFLRFSYENQNSSHRPSELALDGESRVIFHRAGLLAADPRAFHVQHSSILVREGGLYLVALQYEHNAANVTMALNLPFREGWQPFTLTGPRDALYTHCTVNSPQNITVAVHSQDPTGRGADFKSLVLEVSRLGRAGLPSPLQLLQSQNLSTSR
mmetsp:Transcript_29489/g.83179  ORF Transcript_29489/g.83179 Transcript_29489/m.83179 type:complete len:313 (-) Transcript_29489:370-1308(-)|eukprot:CAMPEP_0117691790 /NCGR_PEP_ID=MMETSP0804-20121206/25941_1 /TAXON_ID=1074897 /ORGANISM="Tetraselmis astigmatica, Strain CCMP880" /LENGTH=312 /DNA_ID=CAMNT_0005505113 /DNA_START=222 /DNA_END=1160 /DNA_ORIENTATION=-